MTFKINEVDSITPQSQLIHKHFPDLVNNFVITHTLASTEDQTNIDSMVHELVNSYKNIFSSRYYFICNNCGYKSNELNWMCPSCNTWETIVPKSAVDIIEDGGNSE